MLLSASAYAQTNIAKAMDDLIGNKSYAQYIKSEIYKERDSSGHVSYCYIYGFSLPESKAKVLDNIQRAFDKDADQAYKITKRSSGMSDDRLLMRISYGVNSDKEILLGTKTDFNYDIMLLMTVRTIFIDMSMPSGGKKTQRKIGWRAQSIRCTAGTRKRRKEMMPA